MTDLELLASVPAIAIREGYVDTYHVFGPLHSRYSALRRRADALPLGLRGLVRLFLLSEEVAPDTLILSPPLIEALVRLRILVVGGAGVRTPGLVLLPIAGRLVFVPGAPATGWLGGELMAELVRVAPPRRGTCIDLYAGTGAQAIHLASAGARVIAVDADPALTHLARLNVAMAGLEEVVYVREGDVWLAAPGERFERVTAAPPTLPMPRELAGGLPDGAATVRRILTALPRILVPSGIAHIAGVCLGDARGPQAAIDLQRLARDHSLSLAWTLPARLPLDPGSPGFARLAALCARSAAVDAEVARDRLGDHLARQRANHLYLFFLTASRAAPGAAGVHATSHYRAPGGFWFR